MLRLNSIESTVFDAVDMSADKDIKSNSMVQQN